MNRLYSTLAIALLGSGLSVSVIAQDKSTPAQTAGKPAATSSKSSAPTKKTQLGKNEVRDWKAIDTNHDNLIEPAEMEAYLHPKGSQPSKRTSGSSTKS